jgi:hypothetical protein
LLNSQGVTNQNILDIAYKKGLIKRKRLITPSDLLYAICVESTQGCASYNDLAISIDHNTNKSVSKQAVAKKIKHQFQEFMQEIVKIILRKKMNTNQYIEVLRTLRYKRIIVQDSTIIKLPLALYKIFSGVSNGNSKSTNARIQVTYDLISEQFISFSIDTYSKNDIKSAPELQIWEGDLVLRDRGYLSASEINRHIDNKADCIYRYNFKTQLLDVNTLNPIDLTEMLQQNGNLDLEVRLNNKEKTIVRILSAPVTKEVADERRRKAKKESSTKNHTKEFLKQLDWSIFIVTIPKDKADFNAILKLYSLRWRIEVIFKSWKSNMNFAKYHNVSETQLYVIVLARFIMAMLFTHHIYAESKTIIYNNFKKHLSLMKTIKYLTNFPDAIIDLLKDLTNSKLGIGSSIMSLKRYCCYESRNKRLNFEQEMALILT